MTDVSDEIAAIIAGAKLPPLDDLEAWERRDAEVKAKLESDAAAAERARQGLLAQELVKDHGFPDRAMEHALAGADTQPMLATKSWSADRKNILVLAGPNGIGKTVAACAYVLRSSVAIWRYARSATFARASRYDRADRDGLMAGSLILDDLGAEYLDGKGSFLSDMDELVDFYYSNRRRRLIITTNLTAGEMVARYQSERLISRLREAAVWREMGSAPCLRPPGRGER